MAKYHSYISIGAGLLYLIVLQKFAVPQPVFRFIFPAVLVFSLLVSGYNYWYLGIQQKYNFWVIARRFLFLMGGLGVFSLLPSAGLRGLFLISAAVLVAFFEYTIASFAENILINETLIIAFSAFVTILGAETYMSPFFRPYLGTFYLIAIFAAVLIISRAFYEFIPQGPKVKLLNSLAVALFCTEMFWALTFLPFHYSALAVLLFNVFYLCLILNYYHLFQILNLKKIKFHLIFALVCSLIVLIMTPWKVIV